MRVRAGPPARALRRRCGPPARGRAGACTPPSRWRPRLGRRRLGRRRGDLLRRSAGEQERLGLARPDGHRADRADGDARLRDASVGDAHPHGDGRGGPLAEGQLAVRDAGARASSPARGSRRADRPRSARSRYGPSMNSPSGRTRAGSPPRRTHDVGARGQQERRRVRVRVAEAEVAAQRARRAHADVGDRRAPSPPAPESAPARAPERSISRCVTAAPISTTPSTTRMPVSSGMPRTSTRWSHALKPNLSTSNSSVPPAMAAASSP